MGRINDKKKRFNFISDEERSRESPENKRQRGTETEVKRSLFWSSSPPVRHLVCPPAFPPSVPSLPLF